VLSADLDLFKASDVFGHAVGDELLALGRGACRRSPGTFIAQ
jgi:hypothetical protein